jgi:hypothetical protein
VKNGNSSFNVGGLALGFGLGALFVILLMWIGGAMFHGNGMMGQGTMGQGMTWTSGGMGSIGATILVVIVAAVIGALVAVVHNTVARKY